SFDVNASADVDVASGASASVIEYWLVSYDSIGVDDVMQPLQTKSVYNSGTFVSGFQSTKRYHRLMAYVATTNADAWEVRPDNFTLEKNTGTWFPAMSDWQRLPPTGPGTTTTT